MEILCVHICIYIYVCAYIYKKIQSQISSFYCESKITIFSAQREKYKDLDRG